MKILQVTPVFPPSTSYGGGPNVVLKLTKFLIKEGNEVTVVTTDANNRFNRIKRNKCVNQQLKVFYCTNLNNTIAFKYKIFLSPTMFFILKREIKRNDILLFHDYRTIQNIFAFLFAKQQSIPYVIQAHGSVLPHFFQKAKYKLIFDKLIGKKLFENAKMYFALSEEEKSQFLRFGARRSQIEVMANGIDPQDYLPLPKYGRFRKKYEIPESERIILFLGRIHAIKGLDLLLFSFTRLIKVIPNSRLVIVGPDDGFGNKLKKLAQKLDIGKKIHFTGPLYGKQKSEAFIDSDIFILPSRYETFPLSVLEAWFHKKAVIISEYCGLASLIHLKKAGVVVPYTFKGFYNGMQTLLEDENLKKHYEHAGYELVCEEFLWQKIIKKYSKALSSVLK